MTRITTTFREIFLRWDRYTALQFQAPMTREVLPR
jgi:hypothetical protein